MDIDKCKDTIVILTVVTKRFVEKHGRDPNNEELMQAVQEQHDSIKKGSLVELLKYSEEIRQAENELEGEIRFKEMMY